MKMMVDINKEDIDVIYNTAKEDVRQEVTDDVLEEYLGTFSNHKFQGIVKLMNIPKRFEMLRNKSVGDLTYGERFIVILKWLLYDKIR